MMEAAKAVKGMPSVCMGVSIMGPVSLVTCSPFWFVFGPPGVFHQAQTYITYIILYNHIARTLSDQLVPPRVT